MSERMQVSDIKEKLRENWKVILIPATGCGLLGIFLSSNTNFMNAQIQTVLRIISAATFIVGEIADVDSTVRGLKTGQIVEGNLTLPDHIEPDKFLQLVRKRGYTITALAATFPYMGIPIGLLKIGTALHNYRLLRQINEEDELLF